MLILVANTADIINSSDHLFFLVNVSIRVWGAYYEHNCWRFSSTFTNVFV